MQEFSQEQKVKDFLLNEIKIPKGSLIIMGVSGGSDSVALFRIMNSLQSELEADIRVIHVEHGIRGRESLEDAGFTEDICRKYNIPCQTVSVDVPEYKKNHRTSEEEAARILRYEAFYDAMKEAERENPNCFLAVAHHKEDNAETIILQLLRGTGLKGLTGLQPKRDRIIRPLLVLEKQEILDYLEELGQEYRTDSSNFDTAIQRNRLRQDVFPVFNELNPRAVEHIIKTAGFVRKAEEYISSEAKKWLEENEYKDGSIPALPISHMDRLLAEQVVLEWLRKKPGAGKDISSKQIEIITDMAGDRDGKAVSLPDRKAVIKSGGSFFYTEDTGKTKKTSEEGTDIILPVLDVGMEETIKTPEGEFLLRCFDFDRGAEIPHLKYTKWFDYDRIGNDLHFRTKARDDYFVIDSSGNRQTFRRYCINEKIALERREKILLLAEGSHIYWAVGYRTGYDSGVTEDTRRILEVIRREN